MYPRMQSIMIMEPAPMPQTVRACSREQTARHAPVTVSIISSVTPKAPAPRAFTCSCGQPSAGTGNLHYTIRDSLDVQHKSGWRHVRRRKTSMLRSKAHMLVSLCCLHRRRAGSRPNHFGLVARSCPSGIEARQARPSRAARGCDQIWSWRARFRITRAR